MAHDFFKSQEGVEAYKKVGLTYDDEMWDRQYEGYSKLTRKTGKRSEGSDSESP
jgi:hypothetical protein